MGEEVRITDYDVHGGGGDGEEDDGRVSEWEDGLPNVDELTPLSQSLICSELLSAFNITPEPHRNMTDVNRASQNTLSDLRSESEQQSFTGFDSSKSFRHDTGDEMDLEGDETADLTLSGSDYRKLNRIGSGGDVDGGGAIDETESDFQADDPSARVSKRPRLVWTPQLHKRFIEVVAHLGMKNAVPKTIMQLMNVEGLSRENVASHLQKYRLYLKRNSAAQNSHESGAGGGHRRPPAAIPMPYQPQMVHHMPYGINPYHHDYSLEEWKELEEKESAWNEWEDQKVRRRKALLKITSLSTYTNGTRCKDFVGKYEKRGAVRLTLECVLSNNQQVQGDPCRLIRTST